jgi:ABC-2 type transport system ATP-binding protein
VVALVNQQGAAGAAIETHGLAKRYGRVQALDDLTLRVSEGEIFGFLGPNGAGKTTTIRLLLGLLRPSAGSATLLGRPVTPSNVAAREAVGYLPGELALWHGFSGRATLAFLERLTRRPAVDRDALLERLGLADAELRRPVRTYSDGMKQKLGIVQALQCRPRLAFLDEPTKGLDPLVQQAFYEVLQASRHQGTTVFFSSHVLPEVQRVCDRVAILRAGRLVAVGAVEEIRRAQRRRVRATFAAPTDTASLDGLGEVRSRTATEVELLVAQDALPDLVARLAGMPLADITIEPPSLEDAFLGFYR